MRGGSCTVTSSRGTSSSTRPGARLVDFGLVRSATPCRVRPRPPAPRCTPPPSSFAPRSWSTAGRPVRARPRARRPQGMRAAAADDHRAFTRRAARALPRASAVLADLERVARGEPRWGGRRGSVLGRGRAAHRGARRRAARRANGGKRRPAAGTLLFEGPPGSEVTPPRRDRARDRRAPGASLRRGTARSRSRPWSLVRSLPRRRRGPAGSRGLCAPRRSAPPSRRLRAAAGRHLPAVRRRSAPEAAREREHDAFRGGRGRRGARW
jgi:hypothetical protein